MIRHLAAVPALVRTAAAAHVAYRSELTIWVLTAVMPLIMLALWDAVASEGAIAGYGQTELGRYFIAALVARQLTAAWVIWELNFEIRTGRLSSQLLRPFHPLWRYAVFMLTAMPFRLTVLTPLVLALAWAFPDAVTLPDASTLAVFALSVSLAWSINFLSQCCFGLLSFWVDKSDGLFGVWFALWALLSGYIAPLDMFPDAWRTAIDWLPFRSMLAVPVEVLGGFMTPAEAVPDLLRQALWVGVFWLIVQVLWARGLRRYGAFGA